MENFNQIINQLERDYQDTIRQEAGHSFSKLSTIFEELGGYMREYIQDLTEKDIRQIIKKLESGAIISEDDRKLIRLWIVGDAESYTRLENNYQDWLDELARLISEIMKFKDAPAKVATACPLRGLLRDGARVLSDIFYFQQQKDRVNKFNEASEHFDLQERQILIKLLEQKIKSPDF